MQFTQEEFSLRGCPPTASLPGTVLQRAESALQSPSWPQDTPPEFMAWKGQDRDSQMETNEFVYAECLSGVLQKGGMGSFHHKKKGKLTPSAETREVRGAGGGVYCRKPGKGKRRKEQARGQVSFGPEKPHGNERQQCPGFGYLWLFTCVTTLNSKFLSYETHWLFDSGTSWESNKYLFAQQTEELMKMGSITTESSAYPTPDLPPNFKITDRLQPPVMLLLEQGLESIHSMFSKYLRPNYAPVAFPGGQDY